MTEVIVGCAVGAVTLYLWGWRRFKYVRAYWRNHKRAEEFERALREAREDLAGANAYRAPTDADGELVALLAAIGDDQRALEACGFTLLGDVVVQNAERPPGVVVRGLVDAAGTTCAFLAVARKAATSPTLTFCSYVGDDTFATLRGMQRYLAEPPTMHRQRFDLPLDQLLARHRELVPDGAARVATLDQLVAQLAKARADAVRWRDAQPPDDLLDADLRAVLGEELYRKVGKVWARRLRGKLPQATLRRAS